MKQNPRMAFFIIGIIAFFVFGASYITNAFQPVDIWWTPREMMLSIDECSEDVEIFIMDELLSKRLEAGQLQLREGNNVFSLTKGDIGIRRNNYYRVVASKSNTAAVDLAVAFGGLLLVIFGVIPWFTGKLTEADMKRNEENEHG